MTPEQLGTVTVPSGTLVLVDSGLLRLWSGDSTPQLEPGPVPADVADQHNAGQDHEIVGPDAGAVAALIDLAGVKGRYAFDLPPGGGALAEHLAQITERTGLQAQLAPIERVPHRERVRLLLDAGQAGVEVPFPGGWAVAVPGVPTDRPLRVLGTRRCPDERFGGPWSSVWVELSDAEPVTSTEVGVVLVDEARLLWADADALSAFRSDVAADGLADVALWGGDDATALAEELGAARLEAQGQELGWRDLPVGQAVELVRQLRARRAGGGLRFAFDFRPHDDHHRLLTPMRTAATESATVEVGGAQVTGLFTTWGDGAFPVLRDRAADGSTVRLRVELGAPEIVARTERFEQLWFGPMAELALVSTRVLHDAAPVGWLYREEPDREGDSGWRVFAGDESRAFVDEPANAAAVPLRELLRIDEALEALFRTAAPAAYQRTPDGDFVAAEPPTAACGQP